MTQFIEAVYEDGLFRPLAPVQLENHARVALTVQNVPNDSTDKEKIKRQREALAKLRAKMDSLPDDSPDDGLGGADHDAILYGSQP